MTKLTVTKCLWPLAISVERVTVARRKVIGPINAQRKGAVTQRTLKARAILSTKRDALKENVTTVEKKDTKKPIVGSRKKTSRKWSLISTSEQQK